MSSLCAPRDVISFTFDSISRYCIDYSSYKNRSNFLFTRNLTTQFYDSYGKLYKCRSSVIRRTVVLR